MREYTPQELPGDKFFGLYYHESGSSFSRRLPQEDRAKHVATLKSVQQILTTHYPDCSPLRTLVKKLDVAITSMEIWTS